MTTLRADSRDVGAAPRVDAAGVLDLTVYRAIANLYGGRTVAAAAQELPAGHVAADHPELRLRLVDAFAAALAAADLELDPDERRPRITHHVSYSTRRPGDRPARHVTLLLLAHVRLRHHHHIDGRLGGCTDPACPDADQARRLAASLSRIQDAPR